MCLIAVGTTNVEEVKAANSSWNSWLGEVMYTCPKGYVEAPGTFMEQSDPVTNDKDLKSFTIQCGDNAVWTPRPPHGGTSMPRCIPINCTEIPFPVENNDLGKYNWTGVQGIDPRPYATGIRYWYPRNGWGFPSNGEWEVYIYCEMDGYWSNLDTIEQCEKLSCPRSPPTQPSGPGSEMVYSTEMIHYRCRNGYMFETGQFPYLPVECLNRNWVPSKLPECVPRKCGTQRPVHFKGELNIDMTMMHCVSNLYYAGMDVSWQRLRNTETGYLGGPARSLGDQIHYSCPHHRMTHEGLTVQTVSCIWHRQTDTMLWWPQQLLPCNSKY